MGGGLLERDNQASFKDSGGGTVLGEVTAHSHHFSRHNQRGVMMIVTGSQACLLLLGTKKQPPSESMLFMLLSLLSVD